MLCQVSAGDAMIDENVSLETAIEDNSQVISTTYNPKNFTDLKNNVENAIDGDTIELNGTYEFEGVIKITKSISIVGAGDGAKIKRDPFHSANIGYFEIGESASKVLFKNLKFQSTTNNGWGAIKWCGDNGTLINCEFDHITTINGGALYIAGENCNVSDCRFTNNVVKHGNGAAISLQADNAVINNCLFDNNHANDDNGAGGAIYLLANNCLISNSNFTSNSCSNNGGAIAAYNKNNRIINNIFKNNKVISNLTDSQGGGAIFSDGENLNIDKCSFEDNSASESLGGAVMLSKYDRLDNSYFKGNSASLGNDIYANYTAYLFNNHIVLAYNETQNEAVYGAGLTEVNTTFEITRIDSSITFSAGMVFEYGTSGTIHVIVEGGSIKKENITVLNHPEAKISFTNNVLTVSGLAVGKYTLRVTTTPDDRHYSVDKDLTITVNKAVAVIKASKVTVALKKGSFWTINLVNSKTGKPISNMKLTLKVYTGKKFKTVSLTTNSKGIASYQTKKLTKGAHKVVISGNHPGYKFNTVTSSIKVIKPKKLSFKVKVKNDVDGSSISITTKYKNKPINGVKLNVLVYTGKKYKTVVLKSKTKGKYRGSAGWGTNKVSVGTHKIIVMPAHIKYSGSKTVKIKLKKSAKKYPNWETKV